MTDEPTYTYCCQDCGTAHPGQHKEDCGRTVPERPVPARPGKVTFDEAVDMVIRYHGDTLRELADR